MTTASSSNLEIKLQNANQSFIELISSQQAIEKLQQKDDFINNFSKFDLESRLYTSSATLQDYFEFIAQHVLNWDEVSSGSIISCVEYINTKCINQLKLLILPARIFVILTDGKDENNAAYCRNGDVIVIPRTISRSREIRSVFVHELFHIWSKWNEKSGIRDTLYASIGYNKIPIENSLKFPVSLDSMKITNPDAPIVMKYYINLKKQGDTNNKIYKCTPILHASQSFNENFSKNFFDYLIATTLILDDNTYEPLQPLEYLSYQQASNFFDQIGNNTNYIIHPEEILADNFVFWMTDIENLDNLQTPDIVKKINSIISDGASS